jgi:ATP-dependent 26S proteasome regulatory subunit
MSVKEAKEALGQLTTKEFSTELSALVKSRTPLVYLVTTEERRVLDYFRLFSIAGAYRTFVWDAYNGLLKLSDMKPAGLVSGDNADAMAVLDWILKEGADAPKESGYKGNIYLLLDFHRFMSGQSGSPCAPPIERRLRTFHRMDSNSVIIMVGPHFQCTPALEKCISVIDFPYPNKEEIKLALHSMVDGVMASHPTIKAETLKNEEEIVRSVSGLTLPEAESAFAKSVVAHRRIDIPTLLKEKRQIIRKTGVLEFVQTDLTLDDVGGLGNYTDWVKKRRVAFDDDAHAYGVSFPKGVLLIGVPGGGKSLSAKGTAKSYNMPLIRLDFGALFNSLMGESERTARHALKIAEAVSPCVLWIDEIEKGLVGMNSSGKTDSGVTARVVSTFLTWMQERTSPVFVICTANQHEHIPTEFLRRFDEIFFVDIPTRTERYEIFRALIKRKNRDPDKFDLAGLASASDGYTGAEAEKALENALLEAFADGKREVTTDDILAGLGKVKPLSKMRPEVIEAMQEWAEQRCVKANTSDPVPGGNLESRRTIETD